MLGYWQRFNEIKLFSFQPDVIRLISQYLKHSKASMKPNQVVDSRNFEIQKGF